MQVTIASWTREPHFRPVLALLYAGTAKLLFHLLLFRKRKRTRYDSDGNFRHVPRVSTSLSYRPSSAPP
jgi:hypothetical protein